MTYPTDDTCDEYSVPSHLPIPHLQPGDPLGGGATKGDVSFASGPYAIHPDGDVTTRWKSPGMESGGGSAVGGTP